MVRTAVLYAANQGSIPCTPTTRFLNSAVRVPVLHTGGRRLESYRNHQNNAGYSSGELVGLISPRAEFDSPARNQISPVSLTDRIFAYEANDVGAIPTLGTKIKRVYVNCKKCDEVLTDINFKAYLARAKKNYCNSCWSAINAKTVSDTKRKIFEHYGLVCVCCGDDRFDVLNLDHINGNGKSNRLQLTGGKRAGYPFYRKIIALGFPEGFQTLCRTCNTMKQDLSNEKFIAHIQKILLVNNFNT